MSADTLSMHMGPFLFPRGFFAVGEEPVAVGVTLYHKPLYIRQILNALKADKIELILIFLFGKLVEKADKPSFSR